VEEAQLALVSVVLIVSATLLLRGLSPGFFTVAEEKRISPLVEETTEERVPVIIHVSRVPFGMVVYPQATERVMAVGRHLMVAYDFEPYSYSPLFGIAAGWLPRARVREAFADPNVAKMDYDRLIRVAAPQEQAIRYLSLTEVAQLDNAWRLWELGLKGQGVQVVVVDSGMPPPSVVQVAGAWGVDNVVHDEYGHATAVCYVVRSLAPEAELYTVRVLDRWGMGRISDVVKGLEIAILKTSPSRPRIINLSLGTPPALWDSIGEVASLAVRVYGVKMVAAAGNLGPASDSVLSPATAREVVSVAALDHSLRPTLYTSRGKVETSAFGDVYTYWLNTYKGVSGTSLAAPQVTAILACYASRGDLDWERLDQLALVREASLDVWEEGYDPETGYGLLSGSLVAQAVPVYMPTFTERAAPYLVLLALAAFAFALGWRYAQ
jgi:subtilisin family serine protease